MLPPIMPQQQHGSLFDGSIYGNYFRVSPGRSLIDPLLTLGGLLLAMALARSWHWPHHHDDDIKFCKTANTIIDPTLALL